MPPAEDSSRIAGEPGEEDSKYGTVGSKTPKEKERKVRTKATIATEHVDLINNNFWQTKPWLLNDKLL